MTTPSLIHSALVQNALTVNSECETKRIVLPCLPELLHLVDALELEDVVTDCEDLVDDQDVRVHADADRKTETGLHAAGVGAYRLVDVVADIGKADDLVLATVGLFLGDPECERSEVDVLDARELHVEAAGELQHGRDTTADLDVAARLVCDPGDDLEERRLAGPVLAQDRDDLALREINRDVLEGGEEA